MGNPRGFVKLLTDDILGRVRSRFQIRRYTTNYVDVAGNLTHTDTEFIEWERQQEMSNEFSRSMAGAMEETEESKEVGPSVSIGPQVQGRVLKKQAT